MLTPIQAAELREIVEQIRQTAVAEVLADRRAAEAKADLEDFLAQNCQMFEDEPAKALVKPSLPILQPKPVQTTIAPPDLPHEPRKQTETERRILSALRHGHANSRALIERLGMDQSTIYRVLADLRNAGTVEAVAIEGELGKVNRLTAKGLEIINAA